MNLKKPFSIHYYPTLDLNFWAITKCASTTLRTYFGKFEEPNLTEEKIINEWKKKAHASLRTSKFLVEIDDLKPARNVATIRHPIARFCSMFADLLGKRYWRGSGAGLSKDMSLSDVADYIISTPNSKLDIHLKPQICFLDLSKDIEFMRVENLEDDWLFDFEPPTYKLHETSFNEKLTKSISDKICERYREDLVLWNEVSSTK